MLRRSSWFAKLLVCFTLAAPVSAFALPTLSISSPAADGVFVVRGTGMEGVSGLELWVYFDAATLSNPRVALGSLARGMLNAVNPGNPVRIAILGNRGFTRSGTIATISFARSGASPGRITDVKGSLSDPQGRKVAMAQPVVQNPEPPSGGGGQGGEGDGSPRGNLGGNDAAGGGAGAAGSGGASGAEPVQLVLGGSLNLAANGVPGGASEEPPPVPIEPPGQAEPQPQEPPQPEPQVETAPQETPEQGVIEELPAQEPAAGEGTAPPEAAPSVAPGSEVAPAAAPPKGETVLERFRLFEGERTVQSLTSLFQVGGAATFSQSPPVAIADGKATVRLTISGLAGEDPKFSFDGAKFVDLGKGAPGVWEVEVRPERGAIKASVAVLTDGKRQEYPVAVAPPAHVDLDRSGRVTEADFRLFLRERGTPAEAKFDLNGDGQRDYQDDYIFTANYLARTKERGSKTPP